MSGRDRELVTRRGFLGTAASAAFAAGMAGGLSNAHGRADDEKSDEPMSRGNEGDVPGKSLVVEAMSDHVIGVAGIQLTQLRDMARKSLGALTGSATVEEAWQKLLSPDDVIAVKFNKVASRALNMTDPFAQVLLESLKAAGFDPGRIVAFDLDEKQCRTLQCAMPRNGFSEEVVDFGCGSDSFVSALEPVTALINVGFAKTHHLATMSGCLKNISHGLIRKPSQFHDSGCDPAIACIANSAPIRGRLRVNFINALRVIFRGGSRAGRNDISDHGRIAVSVDPVALDSWAFEQLNSVRVVRGLGPLLPSPRVPSWLVSAAERGLGQFDSERITIRRLRI